MKINKKFIKKKIRLITKKTSKSDKFLKGFVIVFFLFNLFFFSSRYFIPHLYRFNEIASIGEVVHKEDYIFTLDSWEYAEDDDAFEIIVSMQNLSLNEDEKIDYICKFKDKIYDTKLYKRVDDNMLIFRVTGLSGKFYEASFELEVNGNNVKFNMNDKVVTHVDKIEELDNLGYKIKASKSKLKGMSDNIAKLKEEVGDIEKKILKGYDKLDTFDKKQNITEDEKRVMENAKSKLISELEKLKSDIDEKMQKIEENERNVKIEETNLEKLEGDK